MRISRTIATICAAAAFTLPAAGEVQLKTDLLSWNSAIRGGVLGGVNFEEQAFEAVKAVSGSQTKQYSSITQNNINIVGFDSSWAGGYFLELLHTDINPAYYPYNNGSYDRVVRVTKRSTGGTQYMQLNFTTNPTAVAFNLSSYQPYINAIDIYVNGGATPIRINTTAAAAPQALVGLISTDPISRLELYTATLGSWIIVDNIQYAMAASAEPEPPAIPEPSTMLFSGLGLVGFGLFLRRRHRS